MKRGKLCVALLMSVVMLWPSHAQEREDRTLLSWAQMRAIINEVSGERPMHTVLEMVPYPRVRARGEYEGRFRESEVMARLSPEERAKVQADLRKVPTHMTAELNVLLGQKKTALEIRDFLSGEFEPLSLGDLIPHFLFELCVSGRMIEPTPVFMRL